MNSIKLMPDYVTLIMAAVHRSSINPGVLVIDTESMRWCKNMTYGMFNCLHFSVPNYPIYSLFTECRIIAQR